MIIEKRIVYTVENVDEVILEAAEIIKSGYTLVRAGLLDREISTTSEQKDKWHLTFERKF